MEFFIRKAGEADLEAIRDLWGEINDYHARAIPHIFQQGESVAAEQIHSWLHSEEDTFFVAVHGERIVGFVRCVTKRSADVPIFVPRTYMVIDVLVVKEEYRRQGIGKQLMERAHQWAQEQGIDQIELSVWEFNTNAQRLYESLGYTTISRKLWTRLGSSEPSHRSEANGSSGETRSVT